MNPGSEIQEGNLNKEFWNQKFITDWQYKQEHK